MENTRARNNPLATTLKVPGSTPFNTAGVQDYTSREVGVEATANTLALPYYSPILAMLRRDVFDSASLDGALRTWSGDGGYVPSLLSAWEKRWAETSQVMSTKSSAPRLVYAGAKGKIRLLALDGMEDSLLKVLGNGRHMSFPQASPDGTGLLVIISRPTTNRPDLWWFDKSFSRGDVIAKGVDASHLWTSFLQDEARVVINAGGLIELASKDGSERQPIFSGGTYGAFALAPKAKELVFGKGKTIFKISLDGTNERECTSFRYDVWRLSWSPDGRKIAVITTDHYDITELLVMNPDCSGVVRIILGVDLYTEGYGNPTPGKLYDALAWAPDSAKIAFDKRGFIHLVDIVKKSERRVTEGSLVGWSPDGQKILFARRIGQCCIDTTYDLFLAEAHGNGITKIVSGAAEPWASWFPQ
jgi:hypothetical protein